MKIPNASVQNMTLETNKKSRLQTQQLKSEEIRRVLTTPCAKNHFKYTRRRQDDSLQRPSFSGLRTPSSF